MNVIDWHRRSDEVPLAVEEVSPLGGNNLYALLLQGADKKHPVYKPIKEDADDENCQDDGR